MADEAEDLGNEVAEELTEEQVDNEFEKLAKGKAGVETEITTEEVGETEDVVSAAAVDSKPGEAKPGAEDSETDDGASADKKKPAGENEVDFYAGMDEATKAHFQGIEDDRNKLDHRVKSDGGRVKAYQKKAEDLQAVIDKTDEKPTEEQVKTAMQSASKLEEFRKDYPEVAEGIDIMFEQNFAKQDEKINGVLKPIINERERAHESALEDSKTTMDDNFPGWRERVGGEDYQTWFKDQPEEVQVLADSDALDDASDLIGNFYEHLRANGRNIEGYKAEGNDGKLSKKREIQKNAGKTVESRSSGIDATADTNDTESNLFNHFAKKAKEKRQAYG
jgi:hypothetical protein